MKRLSLLLAVPVAATVLTGCFNNSDSTGNDGATIGLAFAPVASMSPYSDDAVLASRMGVGETLVTLGENGDVMPSLAESWSDDSPRSVTFHLRSTKFHDGKPLTAQAAATSLAHAWNATNRPKALGKANLTFDASDDHTLVVTSEKDDPILIQRFADPGTMILSPDAFTGDAKKDGEKNDGKDAEAKEGPSDAAPDLVKHGTGPFSLDKKASSTQADLKANDDYWGGKPKLNSVTVKFMTDASARTAAFRSGEVQLATAIPTSQVSEIEKSAGEIKSTPLPAQSFSTSIRRRGYSPIPVYGQQRRRPSTAKPSRTLCLKEKQMLQPTTCSIRLKNGHVPRMTHPRALFLLRNHHSRRSSLPPGLSVANCQKSHRSLLTSYATQASS